MWERKLKNTKAALKDWVKHSHTNPIFERNEALEKLEKIQLVMEETEITSAMLEKEKKHSLSPFERLGRKKNIGDLSHVVLG